jgi:hypothetical protein
MPRDSQLIESLTISTIVGGSVSTRVDWEQPTGGFVHDREPLGDVASAVGTVELEPAMAAVEGVSDVALGDVEELLGEIAVDFRRQGMEHVDRGASRGGWWHGPSEPRDWPSWLRPEAVRRRPRVTLRGAVERGEMLVAPFDRELPVDVVEVNHCPRA